MIPKLIALILISCIAHLRVMAQPTALRKCGTMDHLQNAIQKDPSFAERRKALESLTPLNSANAARARGGIVTIPVVFHVVYKTAVQNIPESKILSLLQQLNEDYSASNSNIDKTPAAFKPFIGNMGIQFCLAQRTPDGKPSTGINRILTDSSNFAMDHDDVKRAATGGANPWPADKYLNIWISALRDDVLGYSSFPGEAAASDGIVLSYRTVGSLSDPGTAAPYDHGRTATHEIGHWLNLQHIWGDDEGDCSGSDLVDDTPNQASENYGCARYPNISCNNGPAGDMFMNFMDYTDDACMTMFTQGQANRAAAMFNVGGPRYSFLNSDGCVPPIGFRFSDVQPVTISCPAPAQVSINFSTSSTGGYNGQIKFSYGGGLPDGVSVSFNPSTLTVGSSSSVIISNTASLAPGEYTLKVIGEAGTTQNELNILLNVDYGSGPAITSQPIAATVCNGSNASFSVSGSGFSNIQWQVSTNGGSTFSNIAGATSSTLLLSNVQTTQHGNLYRAEIKGNPCGRVVTTLARLDVSPGPTGVLTASETTVIPGKPVLLDLNITPPGTYQINWYKNEILLPAYNNHSEINVDIDNAGEYHALITSDEGCVGTSNRLAITEGESSRLFVYPSPNNGNFSIRYYNSGRNTVSRTLALYNAAGQRVYTKQFSISGVYEKMDINLVLPSGVYTVALHDANGKKVATSTIMIRN